MNRHRPSARRHRSAGFSLLELLTALTIGLIVLAGLVTVLLHSSTARRLASTQTDVLERGRYAMATMEPDIELAGYFGLATGRARGSSIPRTMALPPCGQELVTDLSSLLRIKHSGLATSCPALRNGFVAGTDSITIWRLSRLTSTPEAGRIQVVTSALPLQTTSLISSGQLPPNIVLASRRIELRNLIVRTYYIAKTSDGDSRVPSLRVKTLTSIDGSPAFIDTEVISGVENLQIRALPLHTTPRYVEVALWVRPLSRAPSRQARSNTRYVRHIALQNDA
jgi:type IV pilus assembly protein PilW